MRMGEEPGVRHTFDTGDVPYRTPRLGGVVFADHVAFDIDLDKATRRREVLCAQIGDQQMIVGQLDDVVYPGKLLDLGRSCYQRAGRNVQRVSDVAAENIRAHQPRRK